MEENGKDITDRWLVAVILTVFLCYSKDAVPGMTWIHVSAPIWLSVLGHIISVIARGR